MQALIRNNAILGLLLLAVALVLASNVFSKGRLLVENPPSLSQKINDIQDIEQLRKLSLLLLTNNNETIRDTNHVIGLGIEAYASLCFLCSIFFIANSLSLIKHIGSSAGPSSKWLRWL